jgi:hypothetical protein
MMHGAGEIVDTGLKVEDRVTGAVTRLTDFVADLLTGWVAVELPKISAAEFDSSVEARREHYRQQQAERDRAKAIDRMRDDIAEGRHLDAASVAKLAYGDLVNIRDRGDDGVRAMIEAHEHEQKRARDYGGRTREH